MRSSDYSSRVVIGQNMNLGSPSSSASFVQTRTVTRRSASGDRGTLGRGRRSLKERNTLIEQLQHFILSYHLFLLVITASLFFCLSRDHGGYSATRQLSLFRKACRLPLACSTTDDVLSWMWASRREAKSQKEAVRLLPTYAAAEPRFNEHYWILSYCDAINS